MSAGVKKHNNMFLSNFGHPGLLIVIVLTVPLFVISLYFTYLYMVSAFPSNELAAERFEENGLYEFTGETKDLYFRIAMASPLDRGGSALNLLLETPNYQKF